MASGDPRQRLLRDEQAELSYSRWRKKTELIRTDLARGVRPRAAPETPIIRLRDLRKSFGPITAVDGVSLEIARGEAFGLLGPNGAGKTTTLSMIVGPDRARRRHGRARRRRPAGARDAAAHRHLPAGGLALPRAHRPTEPRVLRRGSRGSRGATCAARVDWALDFAGLTDRADRPGLAPTRAACSAGSTWRRGLVHDPEVLLCDEPTVGVDPQSRNHLYESIERLRDDGRTILYTTHYMEEAQRLCGRVAILDHGAVLALGTPDALIAAHGGVAAVTAELSAPPPPGLALPGVLDGSSLWFESAAPLQEVAKLVELGLRFDALSIQQPDLESVFLALTGRRLRDD